MKDSAYKISLDINEHSSQAVLNAKQSDTGRKVHISLRAGGTPYTIEDNCYAVFEAKKPDGSILYNACSIEGNEIIYEFTEQTCSVVGITRCEIKLYGLGEKLITSPRFSLIVEGTIYPDARVASTDEFTALTKMVFDTFEAKENADKATDNANTAADIANQATLNANTAADSANEASTVAYDAGEKASMATRYAERATENAGLATTKAMGATDSANQASNNANQAAQNANTATDNANLATKNANEAAFKAANTAKSLMVVGEAKGTAIPLDNAIDQYLVGLRVFGKTTQDGTPTPDAPVLLKSAGNDGSITANVTGKNLLSVSDLTLMINNGCVESKTDSSITVTNTAGGTSSYLLYRWLPISALDGKKITVSLKLAADNGVSPGILIGYSNADGSIRYNIDISQVAGNRFTTTYTVDSNSEKAQGCEYICFWFYSRSLGNVKYFDIQVELNSSATEYEIHKKQTLSISTPNGLPGIPVTSGGNYTDANGQQWVCDEIDFAKGVYVQRVVKVTLDGSEEWTVMSTDTTGKFRYYCPLERKAIQVQDAKIPPMMCNCATIVIVTGTFSLRSGVTTSGDGTALYFYDNAFSAGDVTLLKQYLAENPMVVLYVLSDPIEPPLTEEELAAYASLHTYKGNTTVSNDAGAWMDLEYVMDAKKYIDGLMTGTILPATVE